MKRKHLTILLALGLLFSMLLPVGADELEQSQEQLQDINRQIQQQRLEVYNRTQQAKTVTGEISALEQNTAAIERELYQLALDIERLDGQIIEADKEITIKTEEMNRDIEFLAQRLCFVYEQGDVDYLAVLLEAASMRDFLTRYDLINTIIENDKKIIAQVAAEKAALDEEKAQLEVKQNELEYRKSVQLIKKEELESTKNQRQAALAAINQDKGRYEQALNELEAESRQLEQVIRSIQRQNQGIVGGTGSFIYPTDARNITSPYGMRYHPILKQNKLHTGTDFGAGMGANMYAADSGTVIFAGWNNAYGQTIIIDHGNDISTLYAHQSQLLVKNGDYVNQGDIIGKVGSTGWSTGPHAHFEIRINGETVDPMNYL